MPKKYKKARHAIVNVSKKYLSKIIWEFEKSPYESHEKKRPRHDPTYSYFYLARNLEKCMMIADDLNLHVYPLRTEMTATKQIPTSHVCSTHESELIEFLVDKTLSQICPTDDEESKGLTVENVSTEEEESECVHKNINKQKYANNETEYETSSVTHEVPSYFNIFECVGNIFNRLDVTYERACMDTQ